MANRTQPYQQIPINSPKIVTLPEKQARSRTSSPVPTLLPSRTILADAGGCVVLLITTPLWQGYALPVLLDASLEYRLSLADGAPLPPHWVKSSHPDATLTLHLALTLAFTLALALAPSR